MAKVNLNFTLKDITGKTLEVKKDTPEWVNAGKLLGTALWNTNNIKLCAWASAFYKGESVDLGETEKDVLIGFCETYGGDAAQQQKFFQPWNAGFALQIIEKIKKDFDKGK